MHKQAQAAKQNGQDNSLKIKNISFLPWFLQAKYSVNR